MAKDMPNNFGCVEGDKLYRSGIVFPKHIPILKERYGIENVISLIDFDYLDGSEVNLFKFPTWKKEEFSKDLIDKILEKIDSLEGPTLVHCLRGEKRSELISSSYLLKRGHSKFEVLKRALKHNGVNRHYLSFLYNY